MTFITLILLLTITQPAPVDRAESPSSSAADGVDRGLQLNVFPDRVRLQYDLGLSPQAARNMLVAKSRDLPDSEDPGALMAAFRDMVLPEIQRRCRITADEQPLEWRVVESQLLPKHYVQLTCILEANLPTAGERIRLQLVDGSFRGYGGEHLIALKTKEGVQIESSTVPLILARVPRQSLSSDSAAQREAARRGEAVVLRHRPPVDSPPETSTDPLAKASDDSSPANEPRLSADTRWTVFLWVIGCCAGFLAVIVACWQRFR